MVVFLGIFFLQNVSECLTPHQSMYIAGTLENDIAHFVWLVTQAHNPQLEPNFL